MKLNKTIKNPKWMKKPWAPTNGSRHKHSVGTGPNQHETLAITIITGLRGAQRAGPGRKSIFAISCHN